MNERAILAALTRAAFLDAVILSLLSVQSVLPFAFLVMLWLVPIVFALQIYLIPGRVLGMSAVAVTLLALVLLGLDMGLWAAVYVILGAALGAVRHLKLPWVIRLLGLGLTFAATVTAVVVIFGQLIQFDWQEVAALLEEIGRIGYLPIIPALVGGFALWALSFSAAIDWMLNRVLRQVNVEAMTA